MDRKTGGPSLRNAGTHPITYLNFMEEGVGKPQPLTVLRKQVYAKIYLTFLHFYQLRIKTRRADTLASSATIDAGLSTSSRGTWSGTPTLDPTDASFAIKCSKARDKWKCIRRRFTPIL